MAERRDGLDASDDATGEDSPSKPNLNKKKPFEDPSASALDNTGKRKQDASQNDPANKRKIVASLPTANEPNLAAGEDDVLPIRERNVREGRRRRTMKPPPSGGFPAPEAFVRIANRVSADAKNPPPSTRSERNTTQSSSNDVLPPAERQRIERENDAALAAMSEAELEQARREIESQFDPEVLSKILAMTTLNDGADSRTTNEMVDKTHHHHTALIHHRDDHDVDKSLGWIKTEADLRTAAMQYSTPTERRKLAWIYDDESEGEEEGDPEREQANKARFAELRKQRFDLAGVLLTSEREREVESQAYYDSKLYHHGEEYQRPGYTIEELVHLSRSTVVGQRVIALRALAGIFSGREGAVSHQGEAVCALRVALDDRKNPSALPVTIRALWCYLVPHPFATTATKAEDEENVNYYARDDDHRFTPGLRRLEMVRVRMSTRDWGVVEKAQGSEYNKCAPAREPVVRDAEEARNGFPVPRAPKERGTDELNEDDEDLVALAKTSPIRALMRMSILDRIEYLLRDTHALGAADDIVSREMLVDVATHIARLFPRAVFARNPDLLEFLVSHGPLGSTGRLIRTICAGLGRMSEEEGRRLGDWVARLTGRWMRATTTTTTTREGVEIVAVWRQAVVEMTCTGGVDDVRFADSVAKFGKEALSSGEIPPRGPRLELVCECAYALSEWIVRRRRMMWRRADSSSSLEEESQMGEEIEEFRRVAIVTLTSIPPTVQQHRYLLRLGSAALHMTLVMANVAKETAFINESDTVLDSNLWPFHLPSRTVSSPPLEEDLKRLTFQLRDALLAEVDHQDSIFFSLPHLEATDACLLGLVFLSLAAPSRDVPEALQPLLIPVLAAHFSRFSEPRRTALSRSKPPISPLTGLALLYESRIVYKATIAMGAPLPDLHHFLSRACLFGPNAEEHAAAQCVERVLSLSFHEEASSATEALMRRVFLPAMGLATPPSNLTPLVCAQDPTAWKLFRKAGQAWLAMGLISGAADKDANLARASLELMSANREFVTATGTLCALMDFVRGANPTRVLSDEAVTRMGVELWDWALAQRAALSLDDFHQSLLQWAGGSSKLKQVGAEVCELHRTGQAHGHPLLNRALLLLLEGDANVTRLSTWRELVGQQGGSARIMGDLGRLAVSLIERGCLLSFISSRPAASEEDGYYNMMKVLLDYLDAVRAGNCGPQEDHSFFVGVARAELRRYLTSETFATGGTFQQRLLAERMDESLREWVLSM